jgi:rubrerythrin
MIDSRKLARKPLLKPNNCSHPADRQYYNGAQETSEPGKPLYLWTCLDCGTTLSGPKPTQKR